MIKLLLALPVALALCAAVRLSAQSETPDAPTDTNQVQAPAAEISTNSVEVAPVDGQTNLVDALRGMDNGSTSTETPAVAGADTATNEPTTDTPSQTLAESPVTAPITNVDQTADVLTDAQTNAVNELKGMEPTAAITHEEPTGHAVEPAKVDAGVVSAVKAESAAGAQTNLNREVEHATPAPTTAAPAILSTNVPRPPVVATKPAEAPAKVTDVRTESAEKPVVAKPTSDKPESVVTNTTLSSLKIPTSVFVVPGSLKEGRDPFFPESLPVNAVAPTNAAPAEVSEAVELSLQGISGTSEKPLAIINNVTFGQGEQGFVNTTSGRFRIRCLEIKTDSVIVEAGNSRQELRLRRNRLRPQ